MLTTPKSMTMTTKMMKLLMCKAQIDLSLGHRSTAPRMGMGSKANMDDTEKSTMPMDAQIHNNSTRKRTMICGNCILRWHTCQLLVFMHIMAFPEFFMSGWFEVSFGSSLFGGWLFVEA